MRCVAYPVAPVACALAGALMLLPAVPAQAASCGARSDALGTSRVISVDPKLSPRIGTTQYSQTLPLNDHEVVLTFDDGPARPFTEAVLKALADECVKATFFLVGRQAQANPDLVRAIAQAGHSIGTHSQNHPLTFDQMPMERTQSEIDDGIASTSNALGERETLAPFFRIPGLLRSRDVEQHLAARGIAVWSTDADADDWYRTATPEDIVNKAMQRLEAKKRGVLLLHDVQPATALAVPMLLRELKARGWRVVHAVPMHQRPAPVAERSPPPTTKVSATSSSASSWPRTVNTPSVQERPRTAETPRRRGEAESRQRDFHDRAPAPTGPRVRYLTKREWDELGRSSRRY
ncbi:MAG: polysaccharide deacetylase family protein [Pseudolabrys sp.]